MAFQGPNTTGTGNSSVAWLLLVMLLAVLFTESTVVHAAVPVTFAITDQTFRFTTTQTNEQRVLTLGSNATRVVVSGCTFSGHGALVISLEDMVEKAVPTLNASTTQQLEVVVRGNTFLEGWGFAILGPVWTRPGPPHTGHISVLIEGNTFNGTDVVIRRFSPSLEWGGRAVLRIVQNEFMISSDQPTMMPVFPRLGVNTSFPEFDGNGDPGGMPSTIAPLLLCFVTGPTFGANTTSVVLAGNSFFVHISFAALSMKAVGVAVVGGMDVTTLLVVDNKWDVLGTSGDTEGLTFASGRVQFGPAVNDVSTLMVSDTTQLPNTCSDSGRILRTLNGTLKSDPDGWQKTIRTVDYENANFVCEWGIQCPETPTSISGGGYYINVSVFAMTSSNSLALIDGFTGSVLHNIRSTSTSAPKEFYAVIPTSALILKIVSRRLIFYGFEMSYECVPRPFAESDLNLQKSRVPQHGLSFAVANPPVPPALKQLIGEEAVGRWNRALEKMSSNLKLSPRVAAPAPPPQNLSPITALVGFFFANNTMNVISHRQSSTSFHIRFRSQCTLATFMGKSTECAIEGNNMLNDGSASAHVALAFDDPINLVFRYSAVGLFRLNVFNFSSAKRDAIVMKLQGARTSRLAASDDSAFHFSMNFISVDSRDLSAKQLLRFQYVNSERNSLVLFAYNQISVKTASLTSILLVASPVINSDGEFLAHMNSSLLFAYNSITTTSPRVRMLEFHGASHFEVFHHSTIGIIGNYFYCDDSTLSYTTKEWSIWKVTSSFHPRNVLNATKHSRLTFSGNVVEMKATYQPVLTKLILWDRVSLIVSDNSVTDISENWLSVNTTSGLASCYAAHIAVETTIRHNSSLVFFRNTVRIVNQGVTPPSSTMKSQMAGFRFTSYTMTVSQSSSLQVVGNDIVVTRGASVGNAFGFGLTKMTLKFYSGSVFLVDKNTIQCTSRATNGPLIPEDFRWTVGVLIAFRITIALDEACSLSFANNLIEASSAGIMILSEGNFPTLIRLSAATSFFSIERNAIVGENTVGGVVFVGNAAVEMSDKTFNAPQVIYVNENTVARSPGTMGPEYSPITLHVRILTGSRLHVTFRCNWWGSKHLNKLNDSALPLDVNGIVVSPRAALSPPQVITTFDDCLASTCNASLSCLMSATVAPGDVSSTRTAGTFDPPLSPQSRVGAPLGLQIGNGWWGNATRSVNDTVLSQLVAGGNVSSLALVSRTPQLGPNPMSCVCTACGGGTINSSSTAPLLSSQPCTASHIRRITDGDWFSAIQPLRHVPLGTRTITRTASTAHDFSHTQPNSAATLSRRSISPTVSGVALLPRVADTAPSVGSGTAGINGSSPTVTRSRSGNGSHPSTSLDGLQNTKSSPVPSQSMIALEDRNGTVPPDEEQQLPRGGNGAVDALQGVDGLSEKSAVALTTASTSAVVLTAAVGNPVMAGQAVRVGLVASVVDCGFSDPDDGSEAPRPSYFEHPLHVPIGASYLRYIAGSALATSIIFVFLPLCLLFLLHHLGSRPTTVVPPQQQWKTLRAVQEKVVSNGTAMGVSYFSATISKSFMTVLVHGSSDSTAVAVVLVAMLPPFLSLIVVGRFIASRFECTVEVTVSDEGKIDYQSVEKQTPNAAVASGLTANTSTDATADASSLLPGPLSTSKTTSVCWVETFGSFFSASRDPTRLLGRGYFLEETVVTMLLGLLNGLQLARHCEKIAAGMTAVCALHCIYLVIFRPYKQKLELAFAAATSILLLAISSISLVMTLQTERDTLLTKALGIAALAEMSVFFLQALVLWSWAYTVSQRRAVRRRMAEADADDAGGGGNSQRLLNITSLDGDTEDGDSGGGAAAVGGRNQYNPLLI